MFLYNLTLQRATGITCAVHGNFSGSKLQEIIVSRGKILELLRHDPNTGKIYPVLSVEVFGMIRSLMPFRLTGGSKGDFFKLAILTSQVLICWLTIYVNLLNTLVILMLYIPDYVVVGSDSGRIVILEYIAQKNIFEKVCF